MVASVEKTSRVGANGQTTMPKAVRRALGLEQGGRIVFRIDEQRGVALHRASAGHDDPAVDRVLAFLADEIARCPEAVTALSPALAKRISALTKGIAVDLDESIDRDVDL